VAPTFAPMDRFLSVWLPQILRRWLRRRPQYRGVEVVYAEAIGKTDALGHAALETLGAAAARGGCAEIREDLGLDYANPGFNVIPPYRYHAFVCTGPRCATRGALELYERVREAVARRGLTGRTGGPNGAGGRESPSDPRRVSVVRTGCLYPCNLGPMMVVYPDAAWYCALTPAMVERIADQHFVAGRVVEPYTRRPGPERHTRPAPAARGDIVEDAPEPTEPTGVEGVEGGTTA
jgi:(2Fe-2S) ferredoxin